MLKDIVITGLAILSLIGVVFVVCSLLWLALRKPKTKVTEWFRRNVLLTGFVVALVSMLGSLFFSEIMKYTPCELCWFQRICMYSLAVILGIALFRKDMQVRWYAMGLSIIGLCIAGYHYTLQFVTLTTVCAPGEISCIINFVHVFGFLTIPFMALTGFAMIIVLFSIYGQKKK